MKVIPAIDIIDSKVVRLQKGNYNTVTVYNDSVFNQAKKFAEVGISRIHVVDLKGSKDGKFYSADELKKIKEELNIKIQFGGGIRTVEDVEFLHSYNIDFFVIGSISVNNKNEFERIVQKTGNERIIVAADVFNDYIAIKGWTERTSVSIYDHIDYCLSMGINTFLVTDINKDGLLKGPSIDLYDKIKNKFNEINLIASGGISSNEDLKVCKEKNYFGAIVGKAYYEGKINLKEMKEIAC